MASRLQTAMSSPAVSADQAEKSAFDQHQPHQTPAACAHRGPHRQLFAASERAGELQVGDIRAGDEEHAADGDEEEVKILPVIADAGFEQRRALIVRPVLEAG